jgi:hypothetical protein
MHPYQLEVLAAERQRDLGAEAQRDHLTSHARYATAIRPRPRPRARARVSAAFEAFAALGRRYRRKVRAALAPDRSYLLDDRPIAGSSVPLSMWRRDSARAHEQM